MPQLINRIPPGLLSLLGIKGTGLNPVLLGDELRAIIDTTEAYYAAVSQPYEDTTAALTVTGFAGGTVASPPPGELWVFPTVIAKFSAPLAAGTTYRVRVAVAQSGGGQLLHVGADAAAGTVGSQPVTAEAGPIYVRPGELLGVFVEQATLGTAGGCVINGRRLVLTI